MDRVNESRSGDLLENIYASISISSRGVKKKMAARKTEKDLHIFSLRTV